MLRLDESFLIRKDNISYVEAAIKYIAPAYGTSSNGTRPNGIYYLNIKIDYSDRICYLEYCNKDKSCLQDIKNNILNDAADDSAGSKETMNELTTLRNELTTLRRKHVVQIN